MLNTLVGEKTNKRLRLVFHWGEEGIYFILFCFYFGDSDEFNYVAPFLNKIVVYSFFNKLLPKLSCILSSQCCKILSRQKNLSAIMLALDTIFLQPSVYNTALNKNKKISHLVVILYYWTTYA